MKKHFAVGIAGMCLVSMLFAGCSKEVSNEYVKLGQYKGVEVEKVEVPEITEEDVEAELVSFQQQNANVEEITDRAAMLEDTVTISYVGKKDGVEFEGGSAEDYPLVLGSNVFIEGFEEGIVGHKIGETFDLNLTFPEEYHSEDLAGQPVVFTVTIKGIQKETLPELTDEFIAEHAEESKTLEEFKEEVKKNLKESADASAKTTLKENAWAKVMENAQVKKYPEEELKTLTEQLQAQYEQMAVYYGMEFTEFLESYMGMDEATFATQLETAAKEQLKQNLVTELIADKEKIKLSDKELKEKYEEYAQSYGFESVDALKSALGSEGEAELEKMATLDAVQDWIVEKCKQI